eukprot:TRINITY_DN26459_c0_g1_i2.p1 TRINITY_DN26459_c0_g1~~TRINITY_DN26459_c0_g1_i2.p1  ORF type:complete len:364 (+),score=43.52 TRINITY_DN26459_c0_g1_i2:116-1207(+)
MADYAALQPTTRLVDVARQNSKYCKTLQTACVPSTFPYSHSERECLCEWAASQGSAAKSESASKLPAAALPKLSFSTLDSASAAQHFRRTNKDTTIVVMNFANGSTPGGGYESGARAQEECLCRQFPIYHRSLARRAYPFGAYSSKICGLTGQQTEERASGGAWKHYRQNLDIFNRVLITPDVELLRAGPGKQFALLKDEDRFPVTFVAATAPQNHFYNGRRCYNLEATIEHTIIGPLALRMDQQTAPSSDGAAGVPSGSSASPKYSVLILGAWGCGAFSNEPMEMSGCFMEVIHDSYTKAGSDIHKALSALEAGGIRYDEIHFAVPAFRPADEANVVEFQRGLQQLASAWGVQVHHISDAPP